MSYSVSNLFRQTKNDKQPEGKLYNPDIPLEQLKSTNKFITDQAHASLKLTGQPRNGDGFLLPRNYFDNSKYRDKFLTEGAIDPNVIRQRSNPLSESKPVDEEYSIYGINKDMAQAHNNVSLIQQANENYNNYINRFNIRSSPIAVPNSNLNTPVIKDLPTYNAQNPDIKFQPKIIYTVP